MMSLPTITLDYLHLLPGRWKGLWAVWDGLTPTYLPQDPSCGREALLYRMDFMWSLSVMWMTLPDMLVLGGLWVVHFHYVTCFRATLSLADQPSACECGIAKVRNGDVTLGQ